MLVDAEAQSRATTVYLADRRYDMLPAVRSVYFQGEVMVRKDLALWAFLTMIGTYLCVGVIMF
jgi:hypothetical protein